MGLAPKSYKYDFGTFFDYMKDAGVKPVVGFYLDSSEWRRGSISFGEYDTTTFGKADKELAWFDVTHPDKYYWSVSMNEMTIAGEKRNINTKVAVFDTGTT